jgi:hypothetical protein
MCWLTLGVLTDTRCADWNSVCWPILGVLTETRFADWYSVCWRDSVCWTRSHFLTETRCVETDLLPIAYCLWPVVLTETDRFFWLRLYTRLFFPPGKLQCTTAKSATTLDAVSKKKNNAFAPLRYFETIYLLTFSNLLSQTKKLAQNFELHTVPTVSV